MAVKFVRENHINLLLLLSKDKSPVKGVVLGGPDSPRMVEAYNRFKVSPFKVQGQLLRKQMDI